MRKTTNWIIGSITLAVSIYLFSPGLSHLIDNPTAWEMQAQFMYVTGICSMTLMVAAMLLSLRIPKINSIFGGLDKSYEVHKWTGIFTTVFVVIHWLGDKIPLLMVKLNVVPDPEAFIDIRQYTKPEVLLYKSGTLLAEVLFYVFIFLITVSLSKKISYNFFRKMHKLIPGVFLIYAYHGATAPLKEHWYRDPKIFIVLAIISVGCVAAFISLFRLISKSRKTMAIITSIDQHETKIMDIRMRTSTKRFSHQAGQYAFLKFEHSEEPHPFSIASSAHANVLRFAIKELGDFTSDLKNKIAVGQYVQLEGPYGEFKFEDDSEGQVWIAGGIGITPFLARLEYLAESGGAKKPVYFWYCTKGDLDQQFPASLKELCNKAGVTLYHLNENKGEFFKTDILKMKFQHLEKMSVWFCGPVRLRSVIDKGLTLLEFNRRNLHYESFSMR
ncbi:iron reductase [Sphingobacteriaceae bacterium]|nr:iron reductase [Sphingobacteriaceae bacterium]